MDKRYPGIHARGNSIQISLTINGRRARFTLAIPPTPKCMEHAANLRAAAMFDVSKGIFDAAKFFPDSKSSFVTSKQTQKISDALKSFLRDSERLLAPSTLRDYTSAINHHLVPHFGSTRIGELTTKDVHDWIADQCISAKRINNVLIPLRKVFSDAYYAGSIQRNPLDRVKNLQISSESPNPFTLDEIEKILNSCSLQVRALFQFAF